MVSTMSSISLRTPSSTRGTRLALMRNRGLSRVRISRFATGCTNLTGSRIDVDAPAPTPGRVRERPFDRLAADGELPAVLAAQPVQEGGCRTQDVEAGTGPEYTRHILDHPPRLGFRFHIVTM